MLSHCRQLRYTIKLSIQIYIRDKDYKVKESNTLYTEKINLDSRLDILISKNIKNLFKKILI